MLYDLHELQRFFLTPLATFSNSSSQLFTNPYSPWAYTPVSKQIAAGYELLHRLGKDYEKPSWDISCIELNGTSCTVQQHTVYSKPFCELVRFSLDADLGPRPQVLLIAPLSGHHATLLRDTVRTLLHDHDVYVTDWVDARMVPLSAGSFHLNDYVHYIEDFLAHLNTDTHVIAVCQPTVPALAAVALTKK